MDSIAIDTMKKHAASMQRVAFMSIFGQGESTIDEILRQMTQKKWSDKDIFAVNMALEESITNAIEHGNRCDSSKFVHLAYSVLEDSLFVSIRDEGPGFVYQAVPDPREQVNMDKPNGRGILLIRGFMTRVWFNESGNEMFMEKIRSSELDKKQTS